jgi:hypothetical protein
MLKSGLAALALATLGGSLMAHDDGDRERDRFLVRADLEGFQEVPAISTVASGRFRAWVDTRQIRFPGSSATRTRGRRAAAHVHFGQLSVNGGVSFFLCSNLGNGPRHTSLPGTARPNSQASSR